MITIILIFIFVSLLVGFVMLSGQLSQEGPITESREQFLKDLAEFLEGKFQPLGGEESSFRITFAHEGYEFLFEDHEVSGFKDMTYKGYLRVKTRSELNLSFSEKKQKGFTGSSVHMSKTNDAQITDVHVKVPRALSSFLVSTNAPSLVTRLLADQQIVKMLTKFKNRSSRGLDYISLKIVGGTIVLDFENIDNFSPSLSKLRKNYESIEEYVSLLKDFAAKIDL